MNELDTSLSTDLTTVTAEINAYKRVAGEAIFEIGRRLKSVRDAKSDSADEKERNLARQREDAGGWIRWLEESVDFTRQHAHRFIVVYEEFADDVTSWLHVGSRALYEIATLPPEERTRGHTLKSGAVKTHEVKAARLPFYRWDDVARFNENHCDISASSLRTIVHTPAQSERLIRRLDSL